MAGAGQPFYTPILWPVAHVVKMITITEESKPATPTATATLDLIGNATSAFGAVRSFLMAYFCVYVLYDNESNVDADKYPAFRNEHLSFFELNWIFSIMIRNLIATMLICGVWDYILYFSPLSAKLERFKFNPEYPSNEQIKHDIFYTLLSSICGGFIECGLCYCWANGLIGFERDLSESPIWNFVAIVTLTHWRTVHFYFMHRGMHPWKWTGFVNVYRVKLCAVCFFLHLSFIALCVLLLFIGCC